MLGTVGLGGLFLGLLAQRLQTVDPQSVLSSLVGIGVGPLALAVIATGVSFWAVAGYDQAWHRHLLTGVEPGRASRAGFAAIAIGQTVGLGVVSGALVRWRMLPELGLIAAMRLSVLVAASFLLAWVILASVCLIVLPDAPFAGLAPFGLAVAILGLGAAMATGLAAVPNLFTTGRLLALATVDCLAAGLALWLLIPGDLSLAVFLPVFLLALGAGLVSGSPAGLGAFEIVLLTLLPQEPQGGLLAAVVVWRLIAYGLPALAGAAVALQAQHKDDGRIARQPVPPPQIAEAGLAAQGDLFLHPDGFVGGRTAHGLVALTAVADLARFRRAARAEGCWPVLYKLAGRSAVRARRSRMRVLPVAREAWLEPQSFRLEIPSRAGLRRKLRRAEAAGVMAAVERQPDWVGLARINAAWTAARGREHGFAMGRFDPVYLSGQVVVVARHSAAMTGFASFHTAQVEGEAVWTLDLLRPDPAAPEGTAQCLILAALAAAREAGVKRLSLAAVPIGAREGETGPAARLGRFCAKESMRGLDQFKAGFAPRWQRLYIAAPSWLAMILVGAEIWRRVCRPGPLTNMSRTTRQDEEYEFASRRNPCQRREDKQA
ncbi:MAG: phosphatidylglycerol lysyltransferase domain-containing protein [Tabrizicola sp.]